MPDVVTLKLDAMAHGGEAIGRYEGRAIFVPYAIPGEQVRVELVEDRGRYARARLLEVLEPSPARVAPACPYFGPEACGGCQWQHIDYAIQARLKGLVVMDQFRRVGKFDEPPILEPFPDETGWEYRNHALFRTDAAGRLGFLSAHSHDVYPVDDCPILHPLLNDLLHSLDLVYPELEWMELRAGTATGDLMVVLQAREDEPPALEVDFPLSVVQIRHDDAIAPLIGLDYILEVIHERTFHISATSFYQVNSAQAAQLVEVVMEALEPRGYQKVLDAYCGVGLFTAFLSEVAGHVIGIEAHPAAVADARHNLADADNVTLLEGTVEAQLPTVQDKLDAAVVDPPRTGLELAALDALVVHNPARIVYVSCDPATLARDAQRLVKHGYTLQWVQPVDLFPQTYHIENVALLTR
ncbi:MAG TPA: 23S rRNA (uracil(1939)-C(5))-methyltransferase RlmD [Anaerolineae bacterium]|nr:23S rRNA (uracil(1939)-C(5))-methyltransferase RlmD [Anaerolineae bacterium]HQK13376.1 23S rRNA (uracil(1939)-C(5))-methyltransferase RlmD [Anaerolineae bacterium]